MRTKLIFPILLFLFATYISKAQNLSFGIESGINFSNIRKELDNKRFKSQEGPVNGLFAKYKLGNWFVLETGLNHASIYYQEYLDYYYNNDSWAYSSSSYYPPTIPTQSAKNFSFLRIPLLIKYRTPGKINFEIGAGYYYGFLLNDEFRGKDKDRVDKELHDTYFPDMTDWGWILSSAVNYNITKNWSVFASGKITYGKEEYFESVKGTMGTTEFTLGVAYTPFSADKEVAGNDSLGQKLLLVPYAGLNFSNVSSDENKGEYSSKAGFTSGLLLDYSLDKNISLRTGFLYERKGYTVNYQGSYPAVYFPNEADVPRHIESTTALDYLTFPLLMDIKWGNKIRSGISFGAYFSLLQNAFAEGDRTTTIEHGYGYRVEQEVFNKSLDAWFKNTDSGFMLAYHLEIPVCKWANAFAAVNYAMGIGNILSDSEETQEMYPFINDQELKNRTGSVILGLSIPVNKN